MVCLYKQAINKQLRYHNRCKYKHRGPVRGSVTHFRLAIVEWCGGGQGCSPRVLIAVIIELFI